MFNDGSVFRASYEPSMLDIRIENPLRQTIAPVKLMSVMLSYHSVFSASYEPSMLDIRIENPLRQTIAPAKLRGAFSTTSHVMPSLRNTHTRHQAKEGCGSVFIIIHGSGSSPNKISDLEARK